MAQNVANKYLENKVMTSSPQELTLMLYDGAIRFCTKAITSIDEKDMSEAHNAIIKTENIIEEFIINVDKNMEIGKNLFQLYDYMYRRLVEANMKKEKEILLEVQGMLKELRETWKEAMDLAKGVPEKTTNE